ncbi:MAG: hypothetical protein HYY62_02305 [Deltaproteobacteria bacterium]|nr:hypothetical protein [Deltaproteobacteria bacterium]
MSEHRRFQLSCTCGHEFETKLWDALNVTEAKELKGKLLSRSPQVARASRGVSRRD